MEQVNTCQPAVVVADHGGALTVDEVCEFVPNPCLRDLNGSKGIGGDGQKPVEGLNQNQREWNAAVAEAQLPNFLPGHVPFRTC